MGPEEYRWGIVGGASLKADAFSRLSDSKKCDILKSIPGYHSNLKFEILSQIKGDRIYGHYYQSFTVFVCFALIMIVLLQAGKGAEMGGSLRGIESNDLRKFRSDGFLTKLTTLACCGSL